MKSVEVIFLLLVVCFTEGCSLCQGEVEDVGREKIVEELLAKMTLEETRSGIPLIFGFDVIHGHKTIGPIPLAEAASCDLRPLKSRQE